MKTHSLVQGSPEWIAFRSEHLGASEAAAMLGLSTKMTRTELLHLKHTGNAKEFSDYVQKHILDHGHAVEALARPIIESSIGEALYPVTCSNEDVGGKLSASCDGLVVADTKGWEHKQWNQALAEAVKNKELPDEYMAQPQQCMLVTGANEWIFTVSDGTEKNTVSMVVKADPAWFDRIEKGWAQFERDLAEYVPAAVEIKPKGKTPETLPALFVQITGQVTESTLDEYKEHALFVIESINRVLKTDQDFADAAKAVKWCADVETKLDNVKQQALSQTQSIEKLFREIDEVKAKTREARLDLSNLVTRRNTERKDEIVLGGKSAYQTHLARLKAETEGLWVELPTPDFAGSIKNMRLLANMQDAVNTLLANSKIVADDLAKKIRANLALLKADGAGYEFLFNDRANLIAKAADDLKLLIQSRINAHKAAEAAKEEATRERIRAEEQARAEREHAAKVESERIQREQIEQTQAARIREEQAKAEKAAGVEVKTMPGQAGDPWPGSAGQAAITHEAVVAIMPATVRQAMAPKPAAKPETPPTLTLGEISTRLGFNVTSAFLATLDFEATTVKAAKLFHEDDFAAICEALINHIAEVQEQFESAAV